MAAPVQNKYYLKSLHEEIDLFDRKLAHLLKYESFDTDAARTTSVNKMQAKRDLLARTARQLASDGIEFKASDLPRSFRETEEPVPALVQELSAESQANIGSVEALPATPAAPSRTVQSHFAGTVLDGQAYVVEAYKRSRAKVSS